MRYLNPIHILCAGLFLAACSASSTNTEDEPYDAQPPTATSDSGSTDGAEAGPRTDTEPAFDVAALEAQLGALTEPPFGTAAAVGIIHDGQLTTLSRGVRFADGPEATDATPFNLASVSKMLTATMVVTMASEGTLSLDDSVATHLPGVTLIAPDGTDVSGDVTLRDLLRHRAGVPHQPGDQVDPATFNNRWDDPELLEKLTVDWRLELAHQPGSYNYSNMGYMLLGAVIERTGNCRFAECLRAHLDELSASGTTFSAAKIADDGAHGRVLINGEPSFHSPLWYGSTYAMPFNGAWSDVASLAAVGKALDRAAENSASALHPMSVRPDESTGDYGLGVIHGNLDGLPVFAHDGSGPGFHARFLVMPEQDIVFVAVTNGGTETNEEAQRFKDLTNQMLGVVLRGLP